jgi:hypothetical protein
LLLIGTLVAEDKDGNVIKKARASDIFRKTSAGARAGAGTIARKPIVIILILAAVAIVVFLLYIQISSQSYKITYYNALWNQSLAELRSGNATLDEYCINPVHDENLCNQFMSLQYKN